MDSIAPSLKKRLIHWGFKVLWTLSPNLYKKFIFSPFRKVTWKRINRIPLEAEHLVLISILDPSYSFLDIGANKGEYIFTAAKAIGEENVLAFEPNPILFEKLERIFPNARVHRVALTDRMGTGTFKVPIIDNLSYPTRGTITEFTYPNQTDQHEWEVQLDTMDNLKNKEDWKKNLLIKIDVEGVEMRVIQGALKTIQKCRPVLIIEIEQRHHDRSISELIQEIEFLKYTAYFINLLTKRCTQFRSNLERDTDKLPTNYIFFPNETKQKLSKKVNQYLTKLSN